jgi:O-antigen/teichoic acid export membrane protein
LLRLPIRARTVLSDAGPHVRSQTSSPGLTHRAYLNTIAALLDYGSTMAVGLFITPVLIRTLDASLFGVWKILQQLVNYMAVTDGRPTEALKWMIANQQASDDYEAKRRTVACAFVAYLVYLPILLAIGGFLVWVSPTFAKVPSELESVVRIACAVLVLNFFLTGLAQLPASVLRGENQSYRRMGMGALLTLLGGALTVVVARLGFGLVGIGLSQVAIAALTAVFFTIVAKRALAWYGLARPSRAEVRRFLGFGSWFLVNVIVTRLMYATDVVILGYLTSPITVTIYTVTQFASMAVAGLITTVVAAVVPGLGGIIGRREYSRAAELRAEIRTYTWLLATTAGACTLLLNRSFVFLWVGSNRYAGMAANVLIVILALQMIFNRNDAVILDLALNIRRKVILGFLSSLLSIAVAFFLTPYFGIVGLCLGFLLGRLVQTLTFPILVSSYLGERKRLSAFALRGQWVLTAVLFIGAAYAGEYLSLKNWLSWIAAGVVTAPMTALVCFAWGLSAVERTQLRGRLTMLGARVPRSNRYGPVA